MRPLLTRRAAGATTAVALVALLVLGACAAPGTPAGWASYTVEKGAHSASIGTTTGAPKPKAGWLSPGPSSRTYQLTLNGTARYVLTQPTQPTDQLDWNKLPGFSDCGDFDLAQNGAMFGWRWRTDTTPKRLELVPYANNDGVHLYPETALVSLSSEDLDAAQPLRYSLRIVGDEYQFSISGTIRGRQIAELATLPRACPETSPTTGKWMAGLYFGGTSVAPSTIHAYILEP